MAIITRQGSIGLALICLSAPTVYAQQRDPVIGPGITRGASPGPFVTVNDAPTPTITGTADITTRRQNMNTFLWGFSTLPTSLPTVTKDVCAGGITTTPCPPAFNNPSYGYSAALTNVLRVDKYVFSSGSPDNQTYTNYLYIANSPNNNRVVFLSGGHDETCDWTQFQDSSSSPGGPGGGGHTYRIQNVLQGMLSAGYSVFAYSMPRPTPGPCGYVSDHNNMFTGAGSYGDRALGYFLRPSVEAMNYWDTHPDAQSSFTDYSWTGLSGGGWTTTVMAAIDPRVKVSVIVSGNIPGAWWSTGCNKCAGDSEQYWDAFYTNAGYSDLMVMGSTGTGRHQLQIMNYQDNCCFGYTQYSSWNMQTTYSKGYVQYVSDYTSAIQNLIAGGNVGPGKYANMMDYGPATGSPAPPAGTAIPNGATEHQISAWGQQQLMTELAVVNLGSGAAGVRR